MSGDRTRQERLARLSGGMSLDGSMSRSQGMGEGDPRHRRGAQAEGMASLRFFDGHFRVDEDGKLRIRGEFFDTDKFEIVNDELRLKITTPKPATAVMQVPLHGGDELSTYSEERNVGHVNGPAMISNGDQVRGVWRLPPDLDRTADATLTVRYAQLAAGTATCVHTMDAYAVVNGANVVTKDASPDLTTQTTFNGVASGEEDGVNYTLAAATFFGSTVVAVSLNWIKDSGSDDLVFYSAFVTYTPLNYHTHE